MKERFSAPARLLLLIEAVGLANDRLQSSLRAGSVSGRAAARARALEALDGWPYPPPPPDADVPLNPFVFVSILVLAIVGFLLLSRAAERWDQQEIDAKKHRDQLVTRSVEEFREAELQRLIDDAGRKPWQERTP